VRNISNGGSFGANNSAQPGNTLAYRLIYTCTNTGSGPLASIVINDATPAYTTFLLIACGPNVPNVVCRVTTQPGPGGTGAAAWTLRGTLAPGSQSTVTYQVMVQPQRDCYRNYLFLLNNLTKPRCAGIKENARFRGRFAVPRGYRVTLTSYPTA
jgi:hypothetical protein